MPERKVFDVSESKHDGAYWTRLRHQVHEDLLDEGRARAPLTLGRLKNAPEAEIIDKEHWQWWVERQTDPDTVTFAVDWMRLMQCDLDGGRSLDDLLNISVQAAIDLSGLRGHLPGVKFNDIQRVVIQCWKYGHEFVRGLRGF